MLLTLISVPYDLGRESVGSGRGPAAYLEGGAAEALRDHGHDVDVTIARRGTPFTSELDAVLEVNAAVATLVSDAARSGRLPFVLAGNCNVVLGVRAGLLAARGPGAPDVATIWLDAHGDFNTSQTTETGYLDGMPLAMLTGRAFPHIWERLGGWALDESLVLHVGGRDLDPAETDALAVSAISTVSGAEIGYRGLGEAFAPAMDELARRAVGSDRTTTHPPAHLHVDVDVLDPGLAPAVTFPSPEGLTLAELLAAVEMIGGRFDLKALSLTSFAPDGWDGGQTLHAGVSVLTTAASVATLTTAGTRR